MPDAQPAFAPLALISEDLAADRGGRTIFAGVSFALKGGDALAVRGPNGAGKSTLLRVVAGLLRPSAGAVTLAPQQPDRIGGRLHYAGHLDALKGALTVVDNLLFWARLWGADPALADAALDAVGIARLATLPAAVLSAGQRRRAALARLLLAPRPLWLLDEPTASLDASGEALLGQFLSAHLARGGIALIATHADLPIAPTHVLTLGAAA
jgi:heme exporter protein A